MWGKKSLRIRKHTHEKHEQKQIGRDGSTRLWGNYDVIHGVPWGVEVAF